jgi:hypothetical protein
MLKFHHAPWEVFNACGKVSAQGLHRQTVGAGRSANAEINAIGI